MTMRLIHRGATRRAMKCAFNIALLLVETQQSEYAKMIAVRLLELEVCSWVVVIL